MKEFHSVASCEMSVQMIRRIARWIEHTNIVCKKKKRRENWMTEMVEKEIQPMIGPSTFTEKVKAHRKKTRIIKENLIQLLLRKTRKMWFVHQLTQNEMYQKNIGMEIEQVRIDSEKVLVIFTSFWIDSMYDLKYLVESLCWCIEWQAAS